MTEIIVAVAIVLVLTLVTLLVIPQTREFTEWLITRHLLPYGLIASGERAEAVDQGVLNMFHGTAHPLFNRRTHWSRCEVCKEKILSWKRLKLCRKFSCYREAKNRGRRNV